MAGNEIRRQDLAIGMVVEINPRTDRSRERIVVGKIEEILTKAETHPHGILVKLTNEEMGRVKKIIEVSGENEATQETEKPRESHGEENNELSLAALIGRGENHQAEFKTSILWSVRYNKQDIAKSQSPEVKRYGRNASKIIIAKTLAAFLNTDGGYLVIGVKEIKGGADEVVGVESEYGKLRDPCADGYRRMILDVIQEYFPAFVFNHINNYIRISFEEITGATICGIRAMKSDKKVFLNINNEDMFFIRVDASTRQIKGEEVVDYCVTRFR